MQRSLAGLALALSLSGCTLLGAGVGHAYGTSKNRDPRVVRGEREETSVAASTAVGALLGLCVDVAFVAIAISESSGQGSFGH